MTAPPDGAAAPLGPAQTFPPLHDLSRVPRGTVLVVAPHPDDEILGCGGAIALHVRRGDAVHVALVTAGEGGGDAAARLAESRAAAATLGRTELTCLGAPDGNVAGDGRLVARLAELLAAVRPAVVYAPSPFEMHPDHVATLEAVTRALMAATPATGTPSATGGAGSSGAARTTPATPAGSRGLPAPAPRLLLYEVNAQCMATFLLDITPVAAAKGAALSAFASQLGAIDLVARADACGRARTVNVDLPAITHAEAFLELPAERVALVRAQLVALAETLGILPPP
ncbi:MAG TPA: PIG-L family deacetylase [Planctomycetota bacterium]|nr:PIG-L family deacetylase [Planctomycetota bacterium]